MGRYHTHLYIQCSDLRNLCCSATSVVRRKAETHSIIVRKNECHSYIALQFLILHCSFFFLSRRLPGFISALSSPSDLLAAKILEGNRLIFSSFQVFFFQVLCKQHTSSSTLISRTVQVRRERGREIESESH